MIDILKQYINHEGKIYAKSILKNKDLLQYIEKNAPQELELLLDKVWFLLGKGRNCLYCNKLFVCRKGNNKCCSRNCAAKISGQKKTGKPCKYRKEIIPNAVIQEIRTDIVNYEIGDKINCPFCDFQSCSISSHLFYKHGLTPENRKKYLPNILVTSQYKKDLSISYSLNNSKIYKDTHLRVQSEYEVDFLNRLESIYKFDLQRITQNINTHYI